MAGGGGSGHSSAPVPVFPSLSDDGQAAHNRGAGVSPGRCGGGVSGVCLYGELLKGSGMPLPLLLPKYLPYSTAYATIYLSRFIHIDRNTAF